MVYNKENGMVSMRRTYDRGILMGVKHYYPNGQLMYHADCQDGDGGNGPNISFEYNLEGKETRKVVSEKGVFVQVRNCVYFPSGRIKSKKESNRISKSKEYEITEMLYDEKGAVLSVTKSKSTIGYLK